MKNFIKYVNPDSSSRTVAENVKQFHRGCLVAIRRGKLAGIVTERDLVQRVSELMSKPIIITVTEMTARK